MNIVFDIGNTRVKVGLFDHGVLVQSRSASTETMPELADWLESLQGVTGVAVSSVTGGEPAELSRFLTGRSVHHVSYKSRLPFRTSYATPETLGPDRISAVAAVATLYPGENVLVMDAGSCITYDVIDTKAMHHGGAISPGIRMRFRAMHEFTGKLPAVEATPPPGMVGASTEDSMRAGVFGGVLAEIQGTIDNYAGVYPKLKTVLTGGDSPWIEANLKTRIFGAPDLVLYGLNSILELNEVSR